MVQLRNSATRYGAITKTLHWAVFALVAYQFATGLTGSVEDDIHALIGIAVLALVVMRIAWRWLTRLPDWAPGLSVRERSLVHWTERVLYMGLVAKPITGLLYMSADEGEIEVAGVGEFPPLWPEGDFWEDAFEATHAWSGYVLLAAIAVHVGLVLKHTIIDHDRLAFRMLPFTRQ